ncbi:MAG TPA: zf-HC2 domain-containing protein [Gemmatimonadota bacterium]|nr:zf-HC2 domain-containing protein [Gemmatimonadota bacterium]
MTHADHLESGLMAAYLENVCEGEERSRVEAHLAECTDCCRELVALDQTIRTLANRRRGRVVIPLVALGAAAALAGLIVLRPSDTPEGLPEGNPIVQRSQPEERSSIAILGPESGAVVEASEVVLRWASIEPDARYLVTVTTSDGDSVWALMTPDSAAAIPVALDPGGEYLWYVDALLPGGGTATSGIQHFRVPR